MADFKTRLLVLGTEVHTLNVCGKKETTIICRNNGNFIYFPSANSGERCVKAAIKRKAENFDEKTYVAVNSAFSSVDKARHDAKEMKEYLLNLVKEMG